MIINQEQKNSVINIAKEYELDLLVLFGSQATGKIHSKSDVDFGFISSKNIDIDNRFKIENDLGKIFKRKDIELVDMRRISPLMKKIISDEGVLLYQSIPGLFVRFNMYAFKLYIETKPLRELRYQSLKRFAYGIK